MTEGDSYAMEAAFVVGIVAFTLVIILKATLQLMGEMAEWLKASLC